MNNSQLKKENYIPLIVLIASAVAMLLLLLIPHSQYSLLSEMQALGDKENMPLVSMGTITILVIVILGALLVLGTVSFFTLQIYFLRMEVIFLIAFFLIELICELMYCGIGIYSLSVTNNFFSYWNLVPVILNILSFVGFVIVSKKYILNPFKRKMAEMSSLEEEKTAIEHEKYHKEVAGLNKSQMKNYLREKLENKEISPDEYSALIEELEKKS
ncbi:MAG: hypothetical protein WCR67_03145 [Bacilli bacterium]